MRRNNIIALDIYANVELSYYLFSLVKKRREGRTKIEREKKGMRRISPSSLSVASRVSKSFGKCVPNTCMHVYVRTYTFIESHSHCSLSDKLLLLARHARTVRSESRTFSRYIFIYKEQEEKRGGREGAGEYTTCIFVSKKSPAASFSQSVKRHLLNDTFQLYFSPG